MCYDIALIRGAHGNHRNTISSLLSLKIRRKEYSKNTSDPTPSAFAFTLAFVAFKVDDVNLIQLMQTDVIDGTTQMMVSLRF